MQISMQTAEIVKAVYRVLGIAEKKHSQPMLAHVLLDARQKGFLKICATDHVLTLIAEYPVETQTPGAIAIPAHAFYDIVKTLSADKVTLHLLENQRLEIKSGKSQFRLAGLPADDFPLFSEQTAGETNTLPISTFQRLVERTIFCTAVDDTSRPYLNGIYMEAQGKTLQFVATDAHRLALAKDTLEHDVTLPKGVIIPRKALQELKRILTDTEASTLAFGLLGNQIVFQIDRIRFAANLIEGQFPQYQGIIPQTADHHIKLPKTALADALKRVSLLSHSHAWGVKLRFSEKRLELTAEDPEFGDAHEVIELAEEAPELNIGFNARYLLDVLALIPEQGVVFELTNELSPALIHPLENQTFFAVVMPMRF